MANPPTVTPITQNGVLKRDDNTNPVMGGTSSADNATIINSSFDPVTRRLLTETATLSGSGVPATTPVYIGQFYVDTTGDKLYFAKGTSSSSDWIIAN